MTSELDLVNRVDLRLALAESDAQLEQALSLYLAPLLLKLASLSSDVRQAVFKTFQNVFPRISAARELQLPVQALLAQAKCPNVPASVDLSTVRLYSLLFLSKGVERLGAEDQRALVPHVVEGISTHATPVAARLFSVLVKLLETWKLPERGSAEDNGMRAALGFDARPEDEAYLVKKFAKFFLLQPNAGAVPIQSAGLSADDAAFFTKDAGIAYKTPQEIAQVKQRLLEFMRAGFADEALVLPLLIASTDSLSAISDRAETWFRKLTLDYENDQFVSTLVSLFAGEGNAVPPARPMLQDKIMGLLTRSKLALKHPRIKEISELGLLSDYGRLKQTTVAFVRKVTQSASSSDQATYNTDIASRLKDSILADGWPQIDTSQVTNYRTAIGLRQLQYEALGDVLRNSPSLWKDDLSYIRFLFESLEGEVSEMRPVLQGVLSALTVHLPNLSPECKLQLKQLFKEYFSPKFNTENKASCRYLAIKFTNCAFPFSDSDARIICILGTAKTNSSDTIEEAQKGLHPYYFNLLQSSNSLNYESSLDFLGKNSSAEFPTFSNMVSALKDELDSAQEGLLIYRCLGEAVRFVLRVLVMQAIEGKSSVIVKDEDWISRIEKALEIDESVRKMVIQEIEVLSCVDSPMGEDEIPPNSFQVFLALTFDALYNQHLGQVAIASDIAFGTVFTLLVSMSPNSVISELTPIVPRLLELINDRASNRQGLKEICECLGVIGTHPSIDKAVINQQVASFASEEASASSKEAHILAGGFLLSRMVLRSRVDDLDNNLTHQFVAFVEQSLKDSRNYDACLEAISQLAKFGVLGPILSPAEETSSIVSSIYEAVKPKAKACHEDSVLTLCMMSLSMASTYENNSTELSPVESLVYDTHVSKQIDYIFASGEAFAILAGGWDSKSMQAIDIQGESVQFVPKTTGRLDAILNAVLKACSHTKPSLRKAGCIWLLSLVQYLNHFPLIKEQAPLIHKTFMRFLADRDELVQESASRGLSIVYELGDNDLKETLVKSLVKSFTDSNTSATLASGTVELDTELFDKDVLKTDDGSVSTYKDVLSLASDVGDPSLVYKFMSLAKSNALWSSRRGMAFGLGSILSKASLDDMLTNNKNLSSRLIPRLYRYRFDPNTAVSLSMNDIWTVLVSDSAKTVKDNFDIILQEVLRSMGNKEWRTRQGSAAALNNLLQTQPLEVYSPKLEEIWNMSFRAMDDIKESVRKEGNNLSKSLAKTLVRAADPSTGNVSTSKASEMLDYLIPFFLGNKGLLSDAEDVRNFALETILKLCKIGGKAVKPHVPRLLETFIELMSTLEPEVVNYLVLNADKYNLKSSDVDAKRIQSLGHSPMMEAVDHILDLLDDTYMATAVRLLSTSIKKSVGLPSKVCGSRVIVSLITKHYMLSKPYGDKLLTICVGQLNDRNSTVSASFAVAAGYCCKVATLDAVIDYSKHIANLYLNSEDEGPRQLAAIASEAVSKYCGSDRFEAVASAFLPLAFIGKHDSDKDVASVFEREWIESSSGNNAIKLYFEEISLISEEYVKSTNYNVRQVIARSIADMCSTTEVSSQKDTNKLFQILLEACKGKSWSGKELVFEALVVFATKKVDFLDENQDILDDVLKTVRVEGNRRNKHYQLKAIMSVGKFIHSFPSNQDLVDSYVEIMEEVLTDDYFEELDVLAKHDDGKAVTPQEAVANEELYLKYIRNAVDAISPKLISSSLLSFVLNAMKAFKLSDHALTWRTCFAFNENYKLILEALGTQNPVDEKQLSEVANHFRILLEFEEQYKLERNVIAFARNCKLALKLYGDHDKRKMVEYVTQRLAELKENETSTVVLHELESATVFE